MFPQSARWIRRALEEVELTPGARVLDVGSSTEHYRTVEQPHIDREVLAPLREQDAEIIHVDAKDAPGVDVVIDLDDVDPGIAETLGRFQLVLFAGVLPYVRDPLHAASVVSDWVAPSGWLISAAPETYRRTLDPRDNMLRATPAELAAMFEPHGLHAVRAETLRISGEEYYRGLWSRPMWIPAFGRWWLPLPGFSERLRYRVPALRWKESCVLLRRDPDGD